MELQGVKELQLASLWSSWCSGTSWFCYWESGVRSLAVFLGELGLDGV